MRNRADLGDDARTFRATKASVMTVHLCSTVPMGERDGMRGATRSASSTARRTST